MELWEKVFWIVFIIVIVWQFYVEFGFQDCYDGNKECGPQWIWSPQPGDDTTDLVHRIDTGTKAPKRIIKRGLVVVSAAIVAVIISLFVYRKIPEVKDFIVIYFILLGMLWISWRYYESHYTHPISNRTQASVQELKYQMGIETRPSIVPSI